MFCDVLVALPERDVYNKVSHRTTMGYHLRNESRRRGHYIYCPAEKRLGTYKLHKWMEDRFFTSCKGITNDTPVEYHLLDDLQVSPATAALLPKFLRKSFRDHTAVQLVESIMDCGGSELIGASGFKWEHE